MNANATYNINIVQKEFNICKNLVKVLCNNPQLFFKTHSLLYRFYALCICHGNVS